jgi:hypothetical protein
MTPVTEHTFGPADHEDESADPVGDGHADADLARQLAPRGATHPGRDPVVPDEREPPVEPDRQEELPDNGNNDEQPRSGRPQANPDDASDTLGGPPGH